MNIFPVVCNKIRFQDRKLVPLTTSPSYICPQEPNRRMLCVSDVALSQQPRFLSMLVEQAIRH